MQSIKKPVISVIIPAFNAAEFITDSIDSVLGQTYNNLEIIVVDDGSTDDTYAVVKKAYGNNVRLFQKENGGASSARNTGMQNSKGEFIAFLDADDVWNVKKIEIQLKVFDEFPETGVCYSDVLVSENHTRGLSYSVFKDHSWGYEDIFENKRIINKSNSVKYHEISIYSGSIFKYLMYNGMIMPSSSILRREIIDKHDISWNEKYKVAEDSEFFLRLSKVTKFSYVDIPLVKYRKVNMAQRLSANKNIPKRIKDYIEILNDNVVQNFCYYKSNKRWVDYCLSRSYKKLGYYFISEVDLKKARPPILCSIKYYPKDLSLYFLFVLTFCPRSFIFFLGKLKKMKRK